MCDTHTEAKVKSSIALNIGNTFPNWSSSGSSVKCLISISIPISRLPFPPSPPPASVILSASVNLKPACLIEVSLSDCLCFLPFFPLFPFPHHYQRLMMPVMEIAFLSLSLYHNSRFELPILENMTITRMDKMAASALKCCLSAEALFPRNKNWSLTRCCHQCCHQHGMSRAHV